VCERACVCCVCVVLRVSMCVCWCTCVCTCVCIHMCMLRDACDRETWYVPASILLSSNDAPAYLRYTRRMSKGTCIHQKRPTHKKRAMQETNFVGSTRWVCVLITQNDTALKTHRHTPAHKTSTRNTLTHNTMTLH